ncbi:MAG: hypothetical protein ACKVZ6_15915, partial [Kineosporiaceae bacterium]
MRRPFIPTTADGPADGARFRGPFSGPRPYGGPFGRRSAGPHAGRAPHAGLAHEPDEPDADAGPG